MNINKINANLIDEIKNRIPPPVIDSLAEILPMSKEAIYRRLRGDVLFTYSEAVLISQKFQISLDQLNDNFNDCFTFKINRPSKISAEDTVEKIIKSWVDSFGEYSMNEISHLYFTGSGIPIFLIGNYKYLSKFRLYKWFYENRGLEMQKTKLSEMVISDNLSDLSKTVLDIIPQINSTYMLPDNMFEHYIKDLQHFIGLGLIQKQEIEFIKKDLHNLIDEFETIVASGKYKNGANVLVYLTDINIESTFGILETEGSDFAFSKMFGMNYAFSKNEQLCKMYKEVFEDLKDYATMISQSGSVRRIAFFNKQHQIIRDFL